MRTIPVILIAIAAGALSTGARASDGSAVWTSQCAKCHGPDGQGHTKMGHKLDIVDLSDPKVQSSFTDDQAFAAVKQGLKDETGKIKMKAIEGLSDDDIKAVIPVVRAFKK